MTISSRVRHSYDHPLADTVVALGEFGPFCAVCYDLACEEDEKAGIR